MKKDLKSFEAHDKDYGNYFDLEKSKKVAEEYISKGLFEKLGFKKVIEEINGKIKTHIDIGCGTGWLLMKTSPYFEKVIGIEPSGKAIDIAKEIIKENNISNVSFIQMDMIDGINSLNPEEPVFITTATVLSHIKDYHVKEFLSVLNKLPVGSTLFFDEPYEKNIQQNLWHIRSKEWWANNLNNWDLSFRDASFGNYQRGIAGYAVGKENVKDKYDKNFKERVSWLFSGITNKIGAIKRKMLK